MQACHDYLMSFAFAIFITCQSRPTNKSGRQCLQTSRVGDFGCRRNTDQISRYKVSERGSAFSTPLMSPDLTGAAVKSSFTPTPWQMLINFVDILKWKSSNALHFQAVLVLLYDMRFSSGPLALLEPSTNSALLSLC